MLIKLHIAAVVARPVHTEARVQLHTLHCGAATDLSRHSPRVPRNCQFAAWTLHAVWASHCGRHMSGKQLSATAALLALAGAARPQQALLTLSSMRPTPPYCTDQRSHLACIIKAVMEACGGADTQTLMV